MVGASNGARRESVLLSPTPTANTTPVRVVVRIRPSTTADAANVPARFQRTAVQPLGATSLQADNPGPIGGGAAGSAAAGAAKPAKQTFTYDRVVGPDETQADMYEAARPVVDSFLDGFNTTILATGQTASGKSYTMGTDRPPEGVTIDADRQGIIPRAVNEIFDRLAATQRDSRGGFSFEAKVSYIEIYNEDLIDLLAGDAGVRPTVQIREGKGGHILLQGIREVQVSSAEQVMDLLAEGSTLRQTGATGMNAQSSRSHAIFSLTVTRRKWAGAGPPPSAPSTPSSPQNRRLSALPRISSPASPGRSGTPTGDRPASRFGLRPPSSLGRSSTPSTATADDAEGSWTIVTSKLHLVDLAGSERMKRTAAAGDRAKEGIAINAGLSALGNVISALGDPSKKATHIPYRDSKLTRILQDSLGGNARTMMVACVSPAEYNLAETLNTLRFANRARNIKNRAELNEVEQGWDDVDYLQRTIVKLRGELAAIKAGDGGALARRSIDLTSTAGGPAEAELQQKVAQLTAELAVAQAAAPGSPSTPTASLSRDQFAAAVEPIVEEYERSLSALESQLALARAALGHSDEEMRDLEARIEEEQHANEANAALVDELRLRVAKLSEREATTEAYVRDLEARLRDVDDADESHGAAVGELRKELARNREQASSTELYIKELEARLASAEEGNAAMRRQIEGLERDVARREEAQRELEARAQLLDTSSDSKKLLAEIDEKDRRLLDLERELDAVKAQAGSAADEAARLQQLAQAEKAQKEELESRVRTLENGQARTIVVTPPRTPTERAGDADRVVAPASAVSPAAAEQAALVSALQAQVVRLEQAHDETAGELEAARTKYAESLREIEDLNAQVQEARLLGSHASVSDLSDGGVSPALSRFADSRRHSPDDGEEDDEVEELSTSATTPAANGSRAGSPASHRAAGPRTPHARRSIPLSPQHRLSFLGRGQGAVSPSHLRSASLSQELSLAASSQTSCPTSPRAVSPSSSSHVRRESFFGPSSTSSNGGERSYEQMNSEILKLQSALDARDAEISDLEVTVQQLRASTDSSSSSSLVAVPPTPFPIITERAATPPPSFATEADLLLSPSTRAHFDALRASVGGVGGSTTGLGLTIAPTSDGDDALAASRLDDLMRSMAQKESAHREAVDALENELGQLRRQHDELTVLAKTQVENMSAEIEQLRCELEQRPEAGAHDAKLNRLREEACARAQELEAARTAHEAELGQVKAALVDAAHEHQRALEAAIADHSTTLERLREEHDSSLSRATAERDVAVSTALDAVSTQHEEALRSRDAEHAAALQAQAAEHAGETKRQIEALEAQVSQLNADLAARSSSEDASRTDHTSALERQQAEHAAALSALESSHTERLEAAMQSARSELVAKHEEAIEALKRAHADESERAQATITADQESLRAHLAAEHDAALVELRTDHERLLDTLKQDHASALDDLRASLAAEHGSASEEHSQALVRLQGEHSQVLAQLREEHAQTFAALTAERDVQANAVADTHAVELDGLRSEHTSALAERAAAHVLELETLRSSHAEVLGARASSDTEQVERARAELAAQHDEAIATLQREHGEALAQLKAEQTAAADKHVDELSALRTALSEEHVAAMSTLRAEHEKATDDAVQAHAVALDELRSNFSDSHAAALDSLKQEHVSALDDALRSDHATALERQQAEHVVALSALESSHTEKLEAAVQSARSQLVAEHGVAIEALKREHADDSEHVQTAATADHESLRARLAAEHDAALLGLRTEHEASLEALKQGHASALDDLRAALAGEHSSAIEALRQDHLAATGSLEDAIARAQAEHAASTTALHAEHAQALEAVATASRDALSAVEAERDSLKAAHSALETSLTAVRDELASVMASVSTLTAERDGLASRLDSLVEQHTKLVADHAREVNSLRQSLKVQQQAPTAASATSNELQDTLAALGALEQALHESQDERERLIAEVSELRGDAQPSNRSSYERIFKDLEQFRGSATRLDSRLVQTRKERDSLSAQLARMSLSSASATPLGLGIRTQSPPVGAQLPPVDAMSPFTSRAMSPSSELDRATSPPLRSDRFLSNGSTFSVKAPPPTPPPSVPPPPAPLPTAPLPPVPQQSPLRAIGRRSSNSSVTNSPERRRGSLGGESAANSVRDSQTVDTRALKEQEAAIARLKQQLAQRDAEYQSQVDLANTLESALNDSERNLRKARLQSNEYARERDQYKETAERLRLEAQDSHSSNEAYRQSVLDMEERLQEQRNREARAERARQDLESRMAEVNRRKSKFACF